jgi:TetR/AcrR family transcriptional regulator, transcriptional repressor for nem operon
MVSHIAAHKSRTQPPAVRRRRILDAARGVLLEKGYQEASLDDVAARAGIAKGTLYLYFKDKASLVEAVFADMLDALEGRLPLPGAEQPLAALRRAVEESLAFADEQRDFLARFSSPGVCGGALRERFRRHVARLALLFSEGVRAGVLRKHDPELGATVLMSLVRGFLMRKVHNGGKASLRSQAGQVMELLLQGLGG